MDHPAGAPHSGPVLRGWPANTGGLAKQFGSVVTKICRLALPGRKPPAEPTPLRPEANATATAPPATVAA